MKINELLSGREVCECGKPHLCPIDHVIISENAFDSIPAITENYRNILLVADKIPSEPVVMRFQLSLRADFQTLSFMPRRRFSFPMKRQ